MKKSIIVFTAASVIFTMCSKAGNNNDPSHESLFKESEASLELTTKQVEMANRNNEFAFSLLREVAEENDKSFIISPLSATYALGMTAQGASGATRSEITKVLEFGDSQEDLNRFCLNLLYRGLKADEKVSVRNANIVLANNEIHIKKEFSTTVADYYDALTVNMDMTDTKATLGYINNWVSDHTLGAIPSVLNDLDGVLFLINTLYFNGQWNKPFDVSEIKDMLFYSSPSEYTSVKMLTRLDEINYEDNDKAAMVRLPYGNGTFAMTIILPVEGITLDDYLKEFNQNTWKNLTGTNRIEKVNLAFPKFETETGLLLNDIFLDMGINSAFFDADFNNMTDADVCISKILQKSKIKVDEKGTVAASSTVVSEDDYIAMPDERKIYKFVANRPFLYVISDTETDTVYFVGCFRG